MREPDHLPLLAWADSQKVQVYAFPADKRIGRIRSIARVMHQRKSETGRRSYLQKAIDKYAVQLHLDYRVKHGDHHEDFERDMLEFCKHDVTNMEETCLHVSIAKLVSPISTTPENYPNVQQLIDLCLLKADNYLPFCNQAAGRACHASQGTAIAHTNKHNCGAVQTDAHAQAGRAGKVRAMGLRRRL